MRVNRCQTPRQITVAQSQSSVQHVIVNRQLSAPVSQGQCASVVCHAPRVSTIGCLLEMICPPAILWTVWAVVIHAIDAVLSARPTAHVGQEVDIRIAPPIAHAYSSAAVVSVEPARGGVAAFLDARPDSKFNRAAVAVARFTMLAAVGMFARQTTARLHRTGSDVSAVQKFLGAALAATSILRSIADESEWAFDDGKFIKHGPNGDVNVPINRDRVRHFATDYIACEVS